MHQHHATIHWDRHGPSFLKGQYSREHTWTFDGGMTIAASASPLVVPIPWSIPAYVDPEEAFVASISSCHMLTFLFLAAKQGFQCDSYHDAAMGEMTKNERGAYWVSRITLAPRITWSGDKLPNDGEIEQLHHRAHEECFIANSVRTEVIVRPPSGN